MPRDTLRTCIPLLIATLLAPAAAAEILDEALYARLLERHTREVSDAARTRVDYKGLAGSADWKRLVANVGRTRPDVLPDRDARLAYWINVYNILTIDLVLQHYPVDGIREIGNLLRPVWKRPAGRIAERPYSLDEIEHRILRPLGEPRIHAAIVCASVSCPALRREPFAASRLDAQLDATVRGWLADSGKGLRIDRTTRTLWLSRIFQWFEGDFESQGGVIAFIAAHVGDGDRAWLERQGPAVSIEYLDYDWSLNDLARAPPRH
jgi:hypothetical protein